MERRIAERNRPDIVAYKRNYYFPMLRRVRLLERLRYMDESSLQSWMCLKKKGRAPLGVRLRINRPNPGRQQYTLLGLTSARDDTRPFIGSFIAGGVRLPDMVEFWHRIDVIESILPGDVVIFDNFSVHHCADFLSYLHLVLRARGATFTFLPQYHCELNPIENTFGWIKLGLRRHNRGDDDLLLTAAKERIAALPLSMMKNWYRKAIKHAESDEVWHQ